MSQSRPTRPFRGSDNRRAQRLQSIRTTSTARYLSLQEPQLSENIARFAVMHDSVMRQRERELALFDVCAA